MLREINRTLRSIILIIASIMLVSELKKDKTTKEKGSKYGYQEQEFDDIW